MKDVVYCRMINGVILPIVEEVSEQDAALKLASKVKSSSKVFTLANAVEFLASLGFKDQNAVKVIQSAKALLK